MTYKANAVTVDVFGVQFQAFQDEDGIVVYSQLGTAKALEMGETSIRRLRTSKDLEALLGRTLSNRRLAKAEGGRSESSSRISYPKARSTIIEVSQKTFAKQLNKLQQIA